MSIPANEWNGLAAAVRRGRAVPGLNVQIARTPGGRAISASAPGSWGHPWTISPQWSAAKQAWVAGVRAGFVNGAAPAMQLAVADAPAVTLARLMELKQPATGTVNAPLYDLPMLALEWLALGVDGLATDAVPQFFQDRGVGLATPIDPENPDGDATLIDAAPAPGNRLLRKCDVVLRQPRYGLTSDVTIGDGLGTGQATTTVTTVLAPIDPSDMLRVYAISQWVPSDSQLDPDTLTYTEPSYDEIAIGTVYLLSQPDAEPGSGPDQTWQPYVQHGLFWNLAYAQPQFVPAQTEIGDPLLVPLAGGVAQSIINSFTSSIDDAYSEAADFLAAQSMQGSFWAPTGGGSDSRFPAAPPAAAPEGSTGLDKAGRLEAQRAEAQNNTLTEQLDPVFPYYAPAFNLGLLTP